MAICKPISQTLTATGLLAVGCLALLLVSLRPGRAQDSGERQPLPRNGGDKGGLADLVDQLEELQKEVRRQKVEQDDLRRQVDEIESHLTFAPEVEVQQEDYAAARSRFRTNLLRKGPATRRSSPVLPPADAAEVEYPSGELRLKAWLNRPPDEGRKYPALLFLHGGFAIYPGVWELTQPYRDAGFVVMTPTLRAENGQPGAFSYFYDEVDDVLAAADYLAKQPYVDASRLFVAGHSVGGTLTLLAAMSSNQFRAAASFDGAPYRSEFITKATSMPFDTSSPLETQLRSPMAYAHSFKCPVRLYHSSETLIFRLGSLRIASLAKRRGLDVEAVRIEGDHDSHVPRALLQSIAFFQKTAPQERAERTQEVAPFPEALALDLGGGVLLKLVHIAPGKFLMGSPPDEVGRRDDEVLHEVEIAKPYCLGAYTVTQSQFRHVMGMNPSYYSDKGDGRGKVAGLDTDEFPVENLTWEEAMDFCRVLSLLPAVRDKGWIVDLPTEAEWEYACRAGTSTAFHNGGALSSAEANFDGRQPYGGAAKGEFLGHPAPVGSYGPNAWGLYDMHGNVLQWCKDSYHERYRNEDGNGLLTRIVRGGMYSAVAQDCRAARRRAPEPTARGGNLGLRVVVRSQE